MPPSWLQQFTQPSVEEGAGPPHLPLLTACTPHTGLCIFPGFPLHRPSQLTETFHTILQALNTLSVVLPWDSTQHLSPAPACWGPILPVGLGRVPERTTGCPHPSGSQKSRRVQRSRRGVRDALSRESPKNPPGKKHTPAPRPAPHPSAPHSLTSASARLICLSRSSGIIFPLEKKIK